MLANAIVATGLEMTIILGGGGRLQDQSSESRGRACIATHTVGNVTAKTTSTTSIDISSSGLSSGSCVPVQVQLKFTRTTGEEILQVFSCQKPVTVSREEAEGDVD